MPLSLRLSPNATSVENGYFPVACDADDELDAAAELAAVELAADVSIADEASEAADGALWVADSEDTGPSLVFSPPLVGEVGPFGRVEDELEGATSLFEGAATDVVDADWI